MHRSKSRNYYYYRAPNPFCHWALWAEEAQAFRTTLPSTAICCSPCTGAPKPSHMWFLFPSADLSEAFHPQRSNTANHSNCSHPAVAIIQLSQSSNSIVLQSCCRLAKRAVGAEFKSHQKDTCLWPAITLVQLSSSCPAHLLAIDAFHMLTVLLICSCSFWLANDCSLRLPVAACGSFVSLPLYCACAHCAPCAR
jgi:hypothetical protein